MRIWGIQTRLSERLDARILTLPTVQRKKSRWIQRDAYYIGNREFVHFHGTKKIDIRLTMRFQKKHANQLKGHHRVNFRRRPSEWIEVGFSSRKDIEFVFRIVKLVLSANSPVRERESWKGMLFFLGCHLC